MRYSGSKRRFAKDLVPIITKRLEAETEFVDLFCGGCNILSEVDHGNKTGVELNKYVLALWQYIKDNKGMGDIPEFVDEETYYDIKWHYENQTERYPDWLIGYVGACCSYGGAWFNGYARFNPNKNENHIREAYNGLKKQVANFKHLSETDFVNCSYNEIMLKPGSVVYCDPPYAGTKKYESDFDNAAFWEWAREQYRRGVYVYVSEYTAPSDFKCIWMKAKKDGMGTTKFGIEQTDRIEKLFVYDCQEF